MDVSISTWSAVALTGLMLFSVARAAANADTAATSEGPNLVSNASMEKAGESGPAGWATDKWGGEGKYEYAQGGHTGERCVAISSDKGGDVAWKTTVAVEPYSTYRLSGWIKTENVKPAGGARGALLNIHNIQPTATKALTGTTDWTRVEVTFDTGAQDSIQVNCLLGGWGLATGKAWYDDIRVERLGGKDWQPMIALDASKVGKPLSKYVYGQFIEHLGRCIYGGIWAEMLEDRKFFYAVDDKNSPWKAMGGAGAVTMLKERSFVGDQTPRIVCAGNGKPSGIVQAALGLRKGKRYVGRLWTAGDEAVGLVQVSLIWGEGDGGRQTVTLPRPTGGYAKAPFDFTAGADTDDGRLEIVATGKGGFLVGTVSLMPADNVQGMRADTLELLKQLDAPVYRWPGGNFVSGYNWRDGLGDVDRRPPRKNPAWKGVEHNDFGLDEFMTFCRTLGTEPYIAVNSGLGGAAAAAEELQYANSAADTPMGKLRAAHGHVEPYKVRFWGIGNEMYGGWQLGHVPLEQYVKKHNEFAKALRAVDPSVMLVGVGATGKWTEGMLTHCADQMDLLSEHFYCGQKPGLSGHVAQIADAVRRKAEAHRRYCREIPAMKGRSIPIALDEWNYWYGPHVYGELGTRYFLKDALGIAGGLHEMARSSDVFFMANYAQTVNVIGCIKTTKTDAAFATTGLVLKLYRHHFGTLPVATESDGILNAQAAWSADRKTLTLGVVNPTMQALEIPVKLSGAKLAGTGTRWQIAGANPMAYNEPGKGPRVTIEESPVRGFAGKLTVPPCSVTLLALEAESGK